jgi:hypothetical protein
LTKFDAIAHRYLHDARFHALVVRFSQALADGDVTTKDLRDALRLAIVFAQLDREQRAREQAEWDAQLRP